MPDSPRDRAAEGALPPAALALMLLLCLVWGLNTVAMKLAGQGIPPVLLAGLRSLVGTFTLLGWCRWRGLGFGAWRRDGTLPLGLLSGVIFAAEFIAFYIGVQLTTASRAIIFMYGAPFFVAIGAHLLLPEDRLTRAKALGLLVAFAGLVLAFAEGLLVTTGPEALLGDALCLLGGALWGMTTLLVKASRLKRALPQTMLFYQLGLSVPLLLLASPLLGERWTLHLTPLVLGAFLYQAVAIAGISYLVWFRLVSSHSASRLAAFSVLSPIFGVLAGAVLLGDPLGPLFGLAVLLVAAGLWLVNRPAKR
ncbi:DMT family transporter [Siccirubricoccus sp. KC 17139]|uniref:DMT family transporter n=1 Tax=Siccirubricoccus soli TaxID=2899147 RepID=A0ABT1CZD4_9PROT|nr:DMT family transporter [Siccirubricoccus soli]MCO6415009.1 DMT family transporter [Siccirubricoccus soli]MCP2681140.1 DMT family transporter [Siccirubricoccus soli]